MDADSMTQCGSRHGFWRRVGDSIGQLDTKHTSGGTTVGKGMGGGIIVVVEVLVEVVIDIDVTGRVIVAVTVTVSVGVSFSPPWSKLRRC